MTTRGVVLVGARGAGKTTIGRLLAEQLGLRFVDGDDAVVAATGQAIPDLLLAGSFREHEASVTNDVLTGEPVVFATGGGVVLWEGFAAAAAGWRVIWVDADVAVLAQRIEGSDRPTLTGLAVISGNRRT